MGGGGTYVVGGPGGRGAGGAREARGRGAGGSGGRAGRGNREGGTEGGEGDVTYTECFVPLVVQSDTYGQTLRCAAGALVVECAHLHSSGVGYEGFCGGGAHLHGSGVGDEGFCGGGAHLHGTLAVPLAVLLRFPAQSQVQPPAERGLPVAVLHLEEGHELRRLLLHRPVVDVVDVFVIEVRIDEPPTSSSRDNRKHESEGNDFEHHLGEEWVRRGVCPAG